MSARTNGGYTGNGRPMGMPAFNSRVFSGNRGMNSNFAGGNRATNGASTGRTANADGQWHSFGNSAAPMTGRGSSSFATSRGSTAASGAGGSSAMARLNSGGNYAGRSSAISRGSALNSMSASTHFGNFGSSNFSGSRSMATGARFSGTSATHVGFSHTGLNNSAFSSTHFGNSTFAHSNFTGTTFGHVGTGWGNSWRGGWGWGGRGWGWGGWGWGCCGWGWGWGWGWPWGWGFGWGWGGWGFGIGWGGWGWGYPYWGYPYWGWPGYYGYSAYPYYGYDTYDNSGSYNSGYNNSGSYDTGSTSPAAPNNDYLYQGAQQQPEGAPNTNPLTANVAASTPTVLIYQKDGTMYAASDYWLSGGKLHYVVNYGGESSVDMDQVDLQRTVDENAKRGVKFWLKDAPGNPGASTSPTQIPDSNAAPSVSPVPAAPQQQTSSTSMQSST